MGVTNHLLTGMILQVDALTHWILAMVGVDVLRILHFEKEKNMSQPTIGNEVDRLITRIACYLVNRIK